MYTPKYRVIAGAYTGEFDMSIEKLTKFFQAFSPDPCYNATHIEITHIETGEKVVLPLHTEKG